MPRASEVVAGASLSDAALPRVWNIQDQETVR